MFVRGRPRSGRDERARQRRSAGSFRAWLVRRAVRRSGSCVRRFRVRRAGEFARKARATEDVLCFHSSAAPRLSHDGERRKIGPAMSLLLVLAVPFSVGAARQPLSQ